MKFIVTIVLMLLSTACVHAEDWKKTKSQEGNFQVLMPIDAEYSTLDVETDIGVVKTHLFQSFKTMANKCLWSLIATTVKRYLRPRHRLRF